MKLLFCGLLLLGAACFGQTINNGGGGGSSGTVTSIATTSPITGGTITGTGTIGCPLCATAASGGSLTTSGAFGVTLTATGTTNVTLPTSGTLATTSQIPTVTGGTCTNQAVTAISSSAVPSCTTLTSSYVNNSIALTGADINTSNQVTVTHLASPLPIAQGGTNATIQNSALRNIFPTASEVGDLVYCSAFSAGNCTTWSILAGNTSSTAYLQETSGGIPSWTNPGGSGTVTTTGSPAQYQLAVLSGATSITGISVPANGTILQGLSGSNYPTWTATPTLGVAGTTVGTITLVNATSGSLTLSPPTGALGTVTVTVPAATDTLVNLAGTQTLTNKSIETNNNAFTINTVAVTGNSGTGSMVRATGPAITNAVLTTPKIVGSSTGGAIIASGLSGSTSYTYTVPSTSANDTFCLLTAANCPSGTVTSVGFTGGIVSVATGTSTPAFTVAGTSGGVVGFTSSSTWASSAAWAAGGIGYGLGAGSVPVATAAGTAKQIVLSGGSGAPTMIDFPERYMVPAANCNNATAGAGWSIGSGGTVTCRAGTNNLGGYIAITDTSSTFAQFQISIPTDWDSSSYPYILFGLISTDTTSGHTIIPSIAVSCPSATNGTVTDDHAFAATRSATTITVGASAVSNGFYTTSIQLNSTDMANCIGGAFMIVKVGRATDTASTAYFEYADVTFPRLLVSQAN